MHERVHGLDHWHALATRRELARWTGKAGDAAGARDQYALLVPTIERVLGVDHPETVEARQELAYWTESADGAGRDAKRPGK